VWLVVLAQTALSPEIEQRGLALTVTGLSQLLEQPLTFKTTRCNAKLPAAPASTVTDWLVDGPLIAPLPVIDQV